MAKQRKVQEPAAAYTAKKPVSKAAPGQPGIHYANLDEVKKVNEKLMRVHQDILKKLAQ